MAKNKVYIAEFDANSDPYVRKLQSMDDMTKRYTSKIQGHFEKMNKAMNAIYSGVALTAITSFLSASIKAYGEEEKAIKRLDVALGRTNRTLTQYASQLQKLTTFADDQILSAMALISNYVKEEAIVKRLTKATMDFATAKGMDLSAAAELVAKTVGTSTNALTRYGVQIDNNKIGVDRVNEVLQQLIIYQGQAEGEAETYTGKLNQLENQFSDLKDEIAKGVLPVLTEFGDSISKISNNMDSGGMGTLLDKWLKLALIVPRTSLKGLAGLSDLVLGNSDEKDWTGSVGYASNYVKNKVLTGGTTKTGGKGGKQNSDWYNIFTRDLRSIDSFGDVGGAGPGWKKDDYKPPYVFEMQEKLVPELDQSFLDIGQSFVDKFYETENIAFQVGRIFNVSADSFVGKLMQAFDVGSSILSIISSVASLAGGGPLGFLGLAQGGTVVNKHGKLSYAPIPKFARGGSYMVPPGYANDSGIIRVQSGERVDVTPSNQVPILSKLLTSIDNKLAAANMNSSRKGNHPIVIKLTLDGQDITKNVWGHRNRLDRAGVNFDEL
jgi:hypothetical protein